MEWCGEDGKRYEWAVEREWVQDVGKAYALAEAMLRERYEDPTPMAVSFLTQYQNPDRLVAVLGPLDLSRHPDLIPARDELLAKAQYWLDLRAKARPARTTGCLGALVGVLGVAVACVLLLAALPLRAMR